MPAPDKRPCPYCDDATGTGAAPGTCQPEPAWLVHLYVCRSWSTYRIAGQAGLSRQRVSKMLRAAGVDLPSRGTGRARTSGKPAELAGLSEIMRTRT